MENGREARKDNDLFFTCALIDYIARKTKNTRADVVDALGKKRLDKISLFNLGFFDKIFAYPINVITMVNIRQIVNLIQTLFS